MPGGVTGSGPGAGAARLRSAAPFGAGKLVHEVRPRFKFLEFGSSLVPQPFHLAAGAASGKGGGSVVPVRHLGRRCDGPSKQDGESFLHEMTIVRQDLGDAFLSHRLHRNAVGQAVFLIGAGFVEAITSHKRLMGLWAHENAGVIDDRVEIKARSFAGQTAVTAEVGQEFNEYFLGGDDLRSSDGTACLNGSPVPLVAGTSQGDPIYSIRENPPHRAGRLGVP